MQDHEAMSFDQVLDQAIALLRRRERISYRALKRQFNLDDDYVEDLKFELVEVLQLANDQDGIMLVWVGSGGGASAGDADTGAGTQIPQANAEVSAVPPSLTPLHSIVAMGERRQLSIMFCDLVGSTSLSGRFDPEDWREILLKYQAVCAKVVARYEGYIGQYLGDGLLIYFGYPRAHEDEAQRAVRSGLGILEAIKNLNPQIERRWGASLAVRIGIHTGLVVVGEMGVGESRESAAIVGEAPNIAARLQGVAEPGTLIVSSSTQRLISGFFECLGLGQFELKGVADPVTVYQVLRESTARSRLDAAESTGLTPLIGRRDEIKHLVEQWEAAKRGESSALLLQGEAGMGKSRLVRALKEHIAHEPDAWLTECYGSPYYQNTPFHPIVDLLERVVLQFTREESPEEKLFKIEGFLTQYGLDLADTVPLLAALLNVPYEPRYLPLQLSPERQRQRTIDLCVAFVLTRSAQQPLLFVFEDLHWIDGSTVETLTRLMEKQAGHKLLVLLSCRPEFQSPWQEVPHLTSIHLGHLSQQYTRAIIDQMAEGKALPEEVVKQIVQKTDGIPLFVEELTKTVLESGLMREDKAHYELTGGLPSLAIPTTLHDSLLARLDRLAVVKEIAQLAATLAREFDYETLEAVSLWDRTTLQDGLKQLVAAELLYQKGHPPLASYQFKHALIQDTAYRSQLKGRRQQYHLRIARVLSDRMARASDTKPELLAHHFTEAGLMEDALPYWKMAGQHALAQAANLDAIAHLTRGAELLQILPAGPDRDRLELEIQLSLAPAYMAIKGWAAVEVEQACQRARDLSQLLKDGQSLTAALWGLWTNYFLRGQMEPSLRTAEQVFQGVVGLDQPLLLLTAQHAVGFSHYFMGSYSEARRYAEAGIALFQLDMEQVIIQNFQLSSTLTMLSFLASSQWMLGFPEQARRTSARAFALAEQLSHSPSTAYLMAFTLYLYHFLEDIEQAREMAEQLDAIAKEEGFVLWIGLSKQFRGWAMVHDGEFETGISHIREGIGLWQATGTSLCVPQSLALLGDCLIKAGRLQEALEVLADGANQAQSRKEHHFEPEFYRLQGEVFLRQPEGNGARATSAEDCFLSALSLARQQEALMLQLRAALSLSRLWIHQNRHNEALDLLTEIYSQFTEGWESPDLKAAQVLLQQLRPLPHES